MTDADIRQDLGPILPDETPKSFQDLWTYWCSILHGKTCPDAADFDPMKLTRLLPDISIYERRAADDVIYRLAGTAIGERMGHDPTGENVIDLTVEPQRPFIQSIFTAIATLPAGAYVSYENTYASGRNANVQSLLLPLTQTDAASHGVSRIVAIHHMGAAKRYKTAQPKTTVGDNVQQVIWIDLGAGTPGDS